MDESRYGDLLKEVRPRIIESPDEHERLLSIAEEWMEKGDQLGPEEREVLKLIVLLVDGFESQALEDDEEGDDSEGTLPPHMALQQLMTSHGIDLQDVASVFGNPHLAREALSGSRPISHRQAKELGKYFRVPPKLFEE